DIEPKGFNLLTMDGFVTPSLAGEVREILENQTVRNEIVEHNYEVARQFFSYSVVRRNLRALISSLTGY
ncbi:MAG: hypothetical protein VB997_04690, partial [Opitutales bacterium]